VLDVVTLLVAGQGRGSVATLVRACLEGQPHDGIVDL
jgi:hypothetical protein